MIFSRLGHNSCKYHGDSRSQVGFTLLELVLVVAIILLLATSSAPIYGIFFTSTQLNEASAMLVQDIRQAREYAVARVNNSEHGVFFEINSPGNDRYVVFQGPSYALRTANFDRIVELEAAMFFETTLQDNEIVFSAGKGEPIDLTEGSVTIMHSGQEASKVIDVNSLGRVDEN